MLSSLVALETLNDPFIFHLIQMLSFLLSLASAFSNLYAGNLSQPIQLSSDTTGSHFRQHFSPHMPPHTFIICFCLCPNPSYSSCEECANKKASYISGCSWYPCITWFQKLATFCLLAVSLSYCPDEVSYLILLFHLP